jgi:M6 family metalloprotease-like protein
MVKKRYSILIIWFCACLSILPACSSNQSGGIDTPTSSPPTQTVSLTSPAPTRTAIPASPPPTETVVPTITPTTTEISEIDLKLGLHAAQAVGKLKFVLILADFPDVERKVPVEKLSERMLGFVGNYFNAASYQKLEFEGIMTRRYMLPHPVDYYKISPHNLQVDRNKVLSLVRDVVNAADADVQFSQDLYVMIALGATNNEYGMIGYSAVPGMLGFQSDSPILTQSGEEILNAVVFCENAHLGTFIHDTLHMLGGVVDSQRMTPCLYDQDLQALYTDPADWAKVLINMGFWDPLSSHFPYDRALPPSGLSSWTKLRLKWIDPARIILVHPGETTTVRLDPLASQDGTTLLIKIPLSESTYYLVENRQPVLSDVNLPSSGVLILYADDRVVEGRHGNAPVRIMDANPQVPYMNAAAYDIGKNSVFLDTKNGVAIVLLKKDGLVYEIQITTPDKVSSN